MIEPKEISIDLPGGGTKKFIISKFPAVAGREIITQYPTSAAPKIGDYQLNENLMMKLMCHVGVPIKDQDPLMLTTRELIDNHVPGWETLVKIEWETMEYNCSFFTAGRISGILDLVKAQAGEFISGILTSFVQQLSEKDSPPSKS